MKSTAAAKPAIEIAIDVYRAKTGKWERHQTITSLTRWQRIKRWIKRLL